MNNTTVLEPPHPAVWTPPSPPEAFNGTKVLFSFANCSTRPPTDCNGHGKLGGVCFCTCDEGYETDFSNVLNIRWCVPANTLPTAGYRTVNITDPAYAGSSSSSTTNGFLLWLGTRTGMAVSYTISATILAASLCFLYLCIRRYRQAKAARARGKARETHYYHHYPEGGEGRGRGGARPPDDRGNFFQRWWLRKARGSFAAGDGGGGSAGGRRGTVALPAGAAASNAMAVQLLALQQALRQHQQHGGGSGTSLDPAMLQATLAAVTGAMAGGGGGGGAGAGGGAPWSQATAGSPQHPPPQQHRSYDSPARGRTSSVDRHPQRRPSSAGGPARYGSPGHGPGDHASRSRSFVNPLAYMGQGQTHDRYDPYQQQPIVPYSPAGRQSRHGSAGAAPRSPLAHGSVPGGRPMGHYDPNGVGDRYGAPAASPMRGAGGGVRRPTSLGGGLAEPEAAAVVTLPARQGEQYHGKYGMDYGEAKDYREGHYDEGRGYH